MIHLFHGDHIVASRKELQLLRDKFKTGEIITLDGKKTRLTDLIQAVDTESLFSQARLVIIENLLSTRFAKNRKDEEIEKWLKQIPEDKEIVFWEGKELGKTVLGLFYKNIDVAVFKLPKVIFSLMDSIKPGNQTEMLFYLEECLKNDSIELVFAMLVRQIRSLIIVSDLGKDATGMSPWQISKMIQQVKTFEISKLLFLYKKLLEIEFSIKSGLSLLNLTSQLKLFLISI